MDTTSTTPFGYIVSDNENVIHGSGTTVDLAWADAESNFRSAGITLLDDGDDSTEQQGAWTRRSGLRVHPASQSLLAQVEAEGGAKPWRLVDGLAVTLHAANGIIIVDDGAYRWGADAAELLGYFTLHGWEIDGTRVTEPAGPGTDEHGNQLLGETPYDALCQDVLPLPGYDTTDACAAWNDLPSLTAWPSDGPRAWALHDPALPSGLGVDAGWRIQRGVSPS